MRANFENCIRIGKLVFCVKLALELTIKRNADIEDILLVPRNPKYKLEILSAKNVRMFRIGPQNYDFNPEIKWQISARSKPYRFVTYHENWTRFEIMAMWVVMIFEILILILILEFFSKSP